MTSSFIGPEILPKPANFYLKNQFSYNNSSILNDSSRESRRHAKTVYHLSKLQSQQASFS